MRIWNKASSKAIGAWSGHPPGPPRPNLAIWPLHEFLQFSPRTHRGGSQTSAAGFSGFVLPCLCQRPEGEEMRVWASKAALTFSGVSTCPCPSPPIDMGPFCLLRHILIGRNFRSVSLFPQAPTHKECVSHGVLQGTGGSTPCAPSWLSTLQLVEAEVRSRTTAPQTNLQRLDTRYVTQTATQPQILRREPHAEYILGHFPS